MPASMPTSIQPPAPLRSIGSTGRTLEQLWNHFQVERALGERIRVSSREERAALFASLYHELFEKVPDHPRLHRRESESESQRSVQARLGILAGLLTPETVFMEVAPGDCRLACAVAREVKEVFAADISDQRSPSLVCPPNFHMKVFDGFHLDLPPGSVDVAFSYQFLEHLHPDDVAPHMELVAKALKPGGVYVLDTPHSFSGPHDISRYFSHTPQGFHMHEWTYQELVKLGRVHGFDRFSVFRFGRRWDIPLATSVTCFIEDLVGLLPLSLRWKASQRVFGSVTIGLWRSAR
jgi:SAM-dependent methyltransferase